MMGGKQAVLSQRRQVGHQAASGAAEESVSADLVRRSNNAAPAEHMKTREDTGVHVAVEAVTAH